MSVLLTFKMIHKNILETYFSIGNSSLFFLCCRVWPSCERENAPQHPTSFHCGSQHEGCKVCRLPGHCAFRTTGCHLFRFLSFEIIFSAVYHRLFEHSCDIYSLTNPTTFLTPFSCCGHRVSHPVPP